MVSTASTRSGKTWAAKMPSGFKTKSYPEASKFVDSIASVHFKGFPFIRSGVKILSLEMEKNVFSPKWEINYFWEGRLFSRNWCRRHWETMEQFVASLRSLSLYQLGTMNVMTSLVLKRFLGGGCSLSSKSVEKPPLILLIIVTVQRHHKKSICAKIRANFKI